ncbi:MAG: spondin domain-containing protein [Segetibacter sp.]
MKKLFKICCFSGLLLAVASCHKEANISRSFTVTVENVSTPGLLNTPRAGGAVPLSPGAWAVFTGNDPMFTEGKMADIGTERIAEDGAPGTKDAAMGALSHVRTHGIFKTEAGPILPGQSVQFTFNASPGDSCSFKLCLCNPMTGFIVLAVE